MIQQPSQTPKAKVENGHPFYSIIESAYRVFAYPKPTSIEVCTECCMDPAIAADFFNPPVAELPLSYVTDWFSAAYATDGVAKETWAYLLPRILEILAANESPCPVGIEATLKRFDTGNPDNWSSAEWSVLDSFQRLYLQRQAEPTNDYLDDVICMFRLGGWSMADLLSQVADFPPEKLALRLWSDWYGGGVWITAFWENRDNETIFQFYTSPEIYSKMEGLALSDDVDPELASKASEVANVIETYASWS